jgi:hypothetical protein
VAVVYPGATTYPAATLTPGTVEDGVPPVVIPTDSIVTLAEAKRVAPQAPGQSTAAYEADLTGIIAAVSRHLAVSYGAPMPGTRTLRTWQQGGVVILPLGAQVVSVGSGNVTLTGWEFDADSGLLHGVRSYGQAVVTYTVPALPDVREAVLLVIQHAWETRTGANPVPFQSGIDETYTASRGFFVPNRAKELLAPYGTRVA